MGCKGCGKHMTPWVGPDGEWSTAERCEPCTITTLRAEVAKLELDNAKLVLQLATVDEAPMQTITTSQSYVPEEKDLTAARALLERWVPTESFTNEEKLAVIHDTIAFLAPQGEGE